jgi:hypothetical protein
MKYGIMLANILCHEIYYDIVFAGQEGFLPAGKHGFGRRRNLCQLKTGAPQKLFS